MLPICMICGEEHEGEGEDHLSFCCHVCGQCGFCLNCAKPGEHDDCEPRGQCSHEWGTDGLHSNEYCKKCFIPKPKGIA